MRFRILGPLQVTREDELVELGSPKQRAVLAVLLLAQGGVVSVDGLVDALWGDDVPGSAHALLVPRIAAVVRKALGTRAVQALERAGNGGTRRRARLGGGRRRRGRHAAGSRSCGGARHPRGGRECTVWLRTGW